MNENTSDNSIQIERINLVSFLRDLLHGLRRFWWVVLILTTALALISYYRVTRNYVPSYSAEITVAVEAVNGFGTNANSNTAEQMGTIFPYILTSGALSNVIAADMGLSCVPGTIRVSNIEGTNLLTITVTSSSAENAYAVLHSVLDNYPEVAQYVVGQTELLEVEDSETLTETSHSTVFRGSLVRGGLVGFVIGMAFVAVYVLTYRTVRSESELRSLINLNFLGTLPRYRKKERSRGNLTEINILYDGEHSSYVEAMRTIRTRIERQMDGKKVLMVTSPIAGEGKSTVAANLAISMAKKGRQVILVDCDLRSPSQGRIFGLKNGMPGLVSVLRGEKGMKDVLYQVKDHGEFIGLTLLPGGEGSNHYVEALSSNAMSKIIEYLREKADIVILDTPPTALLVDAVMLVRHADAVAYVVMSDYARRHLIVKGVEELKNNGANIIGTILNGGSSGSSGYGYYGYGRYGYGYGYRYGYGYSDHYGTEKTKSRRSGSSKSTKSTKSAKSTGNTGSTGNVAKDSGTKDSK